MLKKFIAHSLAFSLVFNNLAFATQSIIELDFKDSQTPQRLHVIPRMSNVGDVSHLEIDTEQKQAAVYLKEKQKEALDEVEKNSSQGSDVPVITKPVTLQKHDIVNLPWELEPEKLTLFILNHTAWLSPLDNDSYKLEFRGSLLGGGNTGSTGGGSGGSNDSGGGGQCRPSVWSECDNRGNCELNITVCNSYNNNDHSISGTSHHGGNDSTGGYGSSNNGSGSNGGRILNTINYSGVNAVSLDPMMGYIYFPKSSCGYYRSQGMGHRGKNNLGQSVYCDDMTGLCYTQTAFQKNGFLPHDYKKDPLDDKLQQALQAKIEESFYQGIRKATTSGQFSLEHHQRILSPLFYLVRTEITDMLKDVANSRNYTTSCSRQWLEAHFGYRVFFRHAWNVWAHDGIKHDLRMAAHDKIKKYAPEFLKIGLDIFKASDRPLYSGSPYRLTQNRNGEIAVACPYNGLSYSLFAEDRPLGDSYLPHTYIYDPLLDQALWKTVHGYVNGTLSKSPYPTTWKEYIYHTEPAFYVVRTALREAVEQAGKSNVYISVNTRSSLEQQLQKAIAHHILLTPLFKQDSSLNITKTLAPLLFNKGVDLLQASQTRVLKNPNYPYTLTLNTNGDLSSFCPWNGLLYPLFPDDRTNYKAFLPTTYVRDGYDTYLEQFFYKLAGDHFSGQEKSNMLHVLAPLPHVSRTAFKDIPMKKENFPSLRESSTLLLEMAGDVMYGMPLKDFLAKAQQFFDKEIPFKKINNDVLVHQHLTQNMLAKELREDRWALGDQYWKTTSPVAQWGVIANVLEAVARKYNIVGASLIDTAKTRQMLDDLGFELPTFSQEELRTKILPCEKLDGFGRQLCEWVDFNFEPLFNGAIFLMNRGVKVPVNAKLQLKPKVQSKLQQPVKKVEGKQNVEEVKYQKINDLQKKEIATQNFNLKDGATLSEGKALDAAIEFLGKGYKDLGNGRFVSNDGLRQVRMGDGDLLGLHGGGRHMNFEILKVNPKNPAKLLPEQNLHIYLK